MENEKENTQPIIEKEEFPIEALLDTVIQRLKTFPTGPSAEKEIQLALGKIQEGRLWLEKRLARIAAEEEAKKAKTAVED